MVALLITLSTFARADFGRPMIVAIAGGSNSGKTYLAERLVEIFTPHRASLVKLDNYYAPGDQTWRYLRDGRMNYEQPIAFEFDKLASDLRRLRVGETIHGVERNYTPTSETTKDIVVFPRPIIIVEGIHALHPALRDLVDLRIFVDVDRDTRRTRRIRRDLTAGFTHAEVVDYFDHVNQPMYELYVLPSALSADVVVTNPGDADVTRSTLALLRDVIDQRRATTSAIAGRIFANAVDAAATTPLSSVVPTADLKLPAGPSNLDERISAAEELAERIARAAAQPDDNALASYLALRAVPVEVTKDGLIVRRNVEFVRALRSLGAERTVITPCENVITAR